jgi:hypothetical protein
MNAEFPMTNDERMTKAKMPNGRRAFVIKSFGHSFVICLLTVIASASNAFACAACAGGKIDSAMTDGMNAGIFTLLGVIVFVLGGTASVGIYLARRASRMSQLAGSEPVAQPTI